MTRKFFSGSTLDQAVMMAARHYELDPDELAYRQLQKKHGFLRTRKAVMITVDPENPRRQPQDGGDARPEQTEVARAASPELSGGAGESGPERSGTVPEEPEEPDELDEPVERSAPAAWAADDEDEPMDRPAGEDYEDDEGYEDDEDDEDDEQAAWAADDRDDEQESAATWMADEPTERQVAAPAVATTAREETEERDRRPAYREAEPRDVSGDDELLDAAERASRTLLGFAGIDADATARAAGERIEVEIEGPDESVLVVEGGKGLLSVQHLLPRMLRGLTGRSSFVRVDSDGFHQKRKERLEALALKEAEAASRDRRPRTLPPMAPDERRIVHLTLKDSPTVVTESRGTGLHKRVVIRPADDFNEPGDIEARHGF